ncbi:MAG: formyltransferase family protein [Leeuwenhoekiella sp.]
MRIAIIGNNDGPLTLVKSLKREGLFPVAVGLQIPPSEDLQKTYLDHVDKERFFFGFKEAEALAFLKSFDIELLINCFCNFKFKALLDSYKTWNVHPSALPKYRGRHPIHWALINGETEIGVSIHQMTSRFDAGEIYWQKRVAVDAKTSVQEARAMQMEELNKNFGRFILDFMEGKIEPLPNPDGEATYIPMRKPEDSQLTEWEDADSIFRKVMALRSENDAAYIKKGSMRIQVRNAELLSGNANTTAGKILAITNNGITVSSGNRKKIALLGFDPSEFNFKINDTLT